MQAYTQDETYFSFAFVLRQPEGVDVFEVIHDFLIVGVYPDLGRPFWALFYLNLAVLSLSILLVITALGLKARQNRLYFIVYDGSCTRVDLKLAVPVLWSCGAILEIVFATSFKRAYDGQRMTRLMGTIWYLCYIPPAISFTLLSASLAAGTPPLRRYLNRVSYGALRFNAAVAFLVVATLASLIPPAFKHGIPLAAIGTAFTTVIKGIQAAKATQDREALFSLADEIVAIGKITFLLATIWLDKKHHRLLAEGAPSLLHLQYRNERRRLPHCISHSQRTVCSISTSVSCYWSCLFLHTTSNGLPEDCPSREWCTQWQLVLAPTEESLSQLGPFF